MKIKLTLFAMVLAALCYSLYSCSDIVERDLSKQWVYGITPADFSVSAAATQTFKWKEVKSAESYNLQIMETTDTNYSTIKEFVVDTNVRSTQYTCTLKPGYYKWLIYAQNGSSQSGLSVFRFQIDSTSDLAKQKVVLTYPKDNKTTDSLYQTFTWAPISAAKFYDFQIYKEGSNVASFATKISAPTNTSSFTFPVAGGVYYWSVSATNGASSTPATTYKITIDTSSIPVPSILSPLNDSTKLIGNYVSLKWGNVKNATAYYFEVSRNMAQTDTASTIEKPLVTFYNYYHVTLNTKYYWRVKALRAGRESEFSNWVSFKRY